MARPHIAVFSGPTATVGNSPDLVTSNQARARHDLPLLTAPDGGELRFDVLRPQRLAAPATVYVEAFSAHPLEADAAVLYAPADGWVDAAGRFTTERPVEGGTPVYVVELRPEDGLHALPYMARQADGSAWDATTAFPLAPPARSRQTFYPDASRLYEEIDRFGIQDHGERTPLSSIASFDFHRAAPSAGYTMGVAGDACSDAATGENGSERLGHDFFAYYPYHLAREPHLAALAAATNVVQRVLASGEYAGAQWLEGSPTTEETLYWLGLLIDTDVPLVGHTAQRRHQTLSADGDRNLVDGVKFLASGAALDQHGRNRLGAVLIVDELVYAAREVTKVDARPGGYETTGGHGGVVADMGGYGPPRVTFVPARRHTFCSDVRLTQLPSSVIGVRGSLTTGVHPVRVDVRDGSGELLAHAMPHVSITKYARYTRSATSSHDAPDPCGEVEIMARINANLADSPLAGFVCEGMSPFAMGDPTTNAALAVAAHAGMPVVRVGRGNTAGMAYRTDPVFVAGDNLTSTKARMLLMAAILKLGALPVASDPFHPTFAERAAVCEAVRRYQAIFDTH